MTAKEWITKPYGEPKVEIRQVCVVMVLIRNGIAVGLGSSKDDAYLQLLSNLTVDGKIPIEVEQP